jgi:hypothetical protein
MTIRGNKERPTRVTYLLGDNIALVIGLLLTLYALGWFGKRTVEGLKRDRAVVPAQVSTPVTLEERPKSH